MVDVYMKERNRDKHRTSYSKRMGPVPQKLRPTPWDKSVKSTTVSLTAVEFQSENSKAGTFLRLVICRIIGLFPLAY